MFRGNKQIFAEESQLERLVKTKRIAFPLEISDYQDHKAKPKNSIVSKPSSTFIRFSIVKLIEENKLVVTEERSLNTELNQPN